MLLVTQALFGRVWSSLVESGRVWSFLPYVLRVLPSPTVVFQWGVGIVTIIRHLIIPSISYSFNAIEVIKLVVY
jgi:hypothetical protein